MSVIDTDTKDTSDDDETVIQAWYGGFYGIQRMKWKDNDVVKYPINWTFEEGNIDSLLHIDHTNIVRFYAKHCTDYILTEYSDCGSLYDYLHVKELPYTVRDLLSWMHQTAEGLQYIAEKGLNRYFKDINSTSLMLFHSFRTLKIVFSFRYLQGEEIYLSPEEISEEVSNDRSNVYKWGIILCELMSRKQLFFSLDGLHLKIPYKIALGEIHVPNSESIKKLLELCWNMDPVKRPSIGELLSKTDHFLKNYDSTTLETVLSADLEAVMNFKEVQIDKKIREGHFGVTFKATWYSLNIAAKQIKHMITDQSIKKRCRELMRISKNTFEPEYIMCRIFGIASNEEYSYLLMEYVEGKSLFDYLQNKYFSVLMATKLIQSLAEGIHYLVCVKNICPIYLCNMKSTNIIVREHNTKVTICNVCLTFDINVLKDNLNPAYTAPEVFKEGVFTEQSIVYTFGIIFWEVLSRKKAFYEYKRENLIRNAVKAGERPQLKDISPVKSSLLNEFIDKCWHPEPSKRHKLNELLDSFYKIAKKNQNYNFYEFNSIPLTIDIDFADVELIKLVGKSKFGIVYKAVWRDLDVSVKKFKCLSKINITRDVEENIVHLLHLDHENVVRLYGISYDSIDIVHLVMDYADCGSLHNYLHGEEKRDCTDINVLHWMQQAAQGIAFLLNECNVIHCNLSSQNMLLFENYKNLKVSDFCFPADQSSRLDYQDNAYVAPEILDGEPYSKESDVYSFGIILWEAMLRKKPFSEWEQPFSCTQVEELRKGVRPSLSDFKKSSLTDIQDTIKCCWNGDPTKRPTIMKIIKLLQVNPEVLKYDDDCVDDLKFEVVSQINISDISFGMLVGRGQFGKIYQAKWHDENINVQKCERDILQEEVEYVNRELTRLRHANIMKFYGIKFHDNHAFILMDYPECICLYSYLYGEENLEYTFARGLNWMIQYAKGLAYLQGMNFLIHRSLSCYDLHLLRAENYRVFKISLNLPSDSTDQKNSRQKHIGYTIMEVMTRSINTSPFQYYNNALKHIVDIARRCSYKNELEMKWVVSDLTKILTTTSSSVVNLSITTNWWQAYLLKENGLQVPVNFKDIKMEKPIDSGSYGTVFKAKWNDKTFAVKQITIPKEIQTEIKFLKLLEHENIIQLYEVYYELEFTNLFMEYADCGSLYNHLHGNELRNYTMSDAISWMTQLVKAIVFIHGKKPPIIHRDLKTKNILLMDEFKRLKICDFGTVKELATNNTNYVGTTSYIAPEVYKGTQYTEKCDIYSFGIVLWEVMSRRKPFDHLGNRDPETVMYQTTMEQRPRLDDVVPKSEELLNLIKICWHHDPMQRPAASSIKLSELPCFDIDIQKQIENMIQIRRHKYFQSTYLTQDIE